jgi:hypothetical protein
MSWIRESPDRDFPDRPQRTQSHYFQHLLEVDPILWTT